MWQHPCIYVLTGDQQCFKMTAGAQVSCPRVLQMALDTDVGDWIWTVDSSDRELYSWPTMSITSQVKIITYF